jgi:hypothetical protein
MAKIFAQEVETAILLDLLTAIRFRIKWLNLPARRSISQQLKSMSSAT